AGSTSPARSASRRRRPARRGGRRRRGRGGIVSWLVLPGRGARAEALPVGLELLLEAGLGQELDPPTELRHVPEAVVIRRVVEDQDGVGRVLRLEPPGRQLVGLLRDLAGEDLGLGAGARLAEEPERRRATLGRERQVPGAVRIGAGQPVDLEEVLLA